MSLAGRMRVLLVLGSLLASSTALAADPAAPPPLPAAAAPAPVAPPPGAAPPPPAAPYPPPPPPPPPPYPPPPPPYPPPGPPPLELPPPPVAPPQYARRTVELVPHLGLAFPHCQAGDVSSARCEGVSGGLDLGFSALWRMSPHFAAGGALHLAPFANDPDAPSVSEASAGAVFLGFIGRVYFLDVGRLDPYVQVGVGGALLGTTTTVDAPDGSSVEWTETGAGPALQIGAGFDFILTRGLRLGPMVSYTRAFVDKIRSCPDDDQDACTDVSKEAGGYLDSFFTVGARLTILVGQEL